MPRPTLKRLAQAGDGGVKKVASVLQRLFLFVPNVFQIFSIVFQYFSNVNVHSFSKFVNLSISTFLQVFLPIQDLVETRCSEHLQIMPQFSMGNLKNSDQFLKGRQFVFLEEFETTK